MYKESRITFYYTISPLHMGAGDGLGAIDAPIQREVHTNHPIIAGSGIKGALRYHFSSLWEEFSDDEFLTIFGPDTNSSEHAGAISFSDANIVAFPVRSVSNAFLYCTSVTAIARLFRLANIAGISVDWTVPQVDSGCLVADSAILSTTEKVYLESFEIGARQDENLRKIARWISEHVFSARADEFFRAKFERDLVLLPEREFVHFVVNATSVEPHVKIDPTRGVAQDGGLFYVENLPPESLLCGLVLASDGRRQASSLGADSVISRIMGDDCRPGIDGGVVQFGGDSTYGRGLVALSFVKKERD